MKQIDKFSALVLNITAWFTCLAVLLLDVLTDFVLPTEGPMILILLLIAIVVYDVYLLKKKL